MDLRSLGYFVAVAEELHFGRAAARLHMTQPPLSRCVRQLEADLGCPLLRRSPAGVALTPAGARLYDEARALLAQAERARARVAAAAGADIVTMGTLADSAEQIGAPLAAAYRERHPGVHVRIREAGLADPTAGLRAGLVDVALTRLPFDDSGIATLTLRSDPVGVLLRADDPLAPRPSLCRDDLRQRRWFRFPDGTDPVWRDFWGGPPDGGRQHPGPVVATVRECVQSVLWNGTVGLIPLTGQALPDGLVAVRLAGTPPSELVVAWGSGDSSPLVRSFVRAAAAFCRVTGAR